MTAKIELGPDDGTGYAVRITRGFEDGTEEYVTNVIHYTCRGVSSLDITDPWNVGSGKLCHIRVEFTNGSVEYLDGIVTEILQLTKTTTINNSNNDNNESNSNNKDSSQVV